MTLKVLAQGQLTNSKAAIYTATGNAVITEIIFTNTHTSAITMDIYFEHESTEVENRIIPKAMSLSAGYGAIFNSKLPLIVDDVLSGVASTTAVVDYLILGEVE